MRSDANSPTFARQATGLRDRRVRDGRTKEESLVKRSGLALALAVSSVVLIGGFAAPPRACRIRRAP